MWKWRRGCGTVRLTEDRQSMLTATFSVSVTSCSTLGKCDFPSTDCVERIEALDSILRHDPLEKGERLSRKLCHVKEEY